MRPKVVALAVCAVLAFYLVTLGQRGVLLLREGTLVAVGLGIGLLLLPLVAAWTVLRELRFGAASQRLGRELGAEGGLPVDDLPRTPGGRVDRAAADAAFEGVRADVEASPQDWRAWYRLALAYDAAGDRKRARAAVRQAIRLHG